MQIIVIKWYTQFFLTLLVDEKRKDILKTLLKQARHDGPAYDSLCLCQSKDLLCYTDMALHASPI